MQLELQAENMKSFHNADEENVGLTVNEDGDSTTKIYTPTISDELRPKIGQEYETLDDALAFYNAYAKACGFSVRNWTTTKDKGTDEIKRKEFVCFKQGRPNLIAEVGVTRRRGSIGENCRARLVVLKSKTEKYRVTIFNEAHTHPLSTPSKTHLLRSHRNVSATAKCLAKHLDMVNIPKHKQYSLFEVQSGGIQNVGFTQRDMYNYSRDIRADMKGHDGEMFVEYLKSEQEKNPSFIFKVETDDENKITRCFWADATSRRAYHFFGDVVIFDTTYNTNRYGLIFAPIVGVNNHGQTIIFACGFLSHEGEDDFIWLFTQFLEAMPGAAPKMIITDQDRAMTAAFPIVLPNTLHRYCMWHILMKFSEKIDTGKYIEYKDAFSACIWNSESPMEFDLQWASIIQKAELGKNTWLKDMFDIRSKWIPAYVNHVFSADMSSSQRAESGHAFFKKFISRNNSLVDFMVQFGRGLVRQRHEELIADHKDKIEKPKLRISHDFLVQMVEIYTHESFYKFEDELCNSFNRRFELLSETEDERVYRVQRRNVDTSKVRHIVYNKMTDFASCTCRKFDSAGIPCRHIIAYLEKFDDHGKLPDGYILKRWTKSAKLGTVEDANGVQVVVDGNYPTNLLMQSQLAQSYFDVVDKALVCDETAKIFTDGMRSISYQIDQYVCSRPSAMGSTFEKSNPFGNTNTNSMHASCSVQSSYKEPDLVRYKGCGKRLKGGKEKAMARAKSQKVRRCHGCNQFGQTHDKRNCPKVLNLSSTLIDDANLGDKDGDYANLGEEDGDDANLKVGDNANLGDD